MSFEHAAALAAFETFVGGTARAEAVEACCAAGSVADAVEAMRRAMRRHRWPTAAGEVSLRAMVDALDARTRKEGLHVIHGWDFAKQQRPADIAPVLLLDYCERLGITEERLRPALAMLLDQYCLAVLSLFVVRAWDGGDADATLDRLDAALAAIEGPHGCGQPVAGDVDTLLLLAVAYFHPEEQGYATLLERLATLGPSRAYRFAVPCAAVFGSHLRWGMRFMYRSDAGALRADNGMDYPWVLLAIRTALREYARAIRKNEAARLPAAEAVLNCLTPDPWAFTGKPPSFFAGFEAWHAEVQDLLRTHRDALLADAERLTPSPRAYASLAFESNFVSNASVAMATFALAEGPRLPALTALWAAAGRTDEQRAASETLARALMGYATGDPARLGAHGAPLIVYDPFDGAHHVNVVRRALQEFA